MSRLSRRTFLTASAALVAAPALGPRALAAEVDVVIVGAGAAGIAAARRIAAAGRSFRLFEASNRVGGRCATDSKIFGVPFDLGAHWIRNPDSNPVVAAAGQSGLDIYPAPRAQTLRVGPRMARDAELETFLASTLKAQRALGALGKAKTDFPASRLLPKDLGDWQATVEFMYGPFATGKDLKDISAFERVRAVERDGDAFCPQGYGTLLAKLAAGLSVQLSSPVGLIYWGGNALAVDTPKGNLLTRAVILTVSPSVLASDSIEFMPTLPKRWNDAAEKLAPGSYDHIAFEIPGNPLDLQRDDMVFEQASGPRTAALLANVSGTGLHLVEVGGSFGRELAKQGEPAMIDFGREWLVAMFGSNVKNAIKRSHATNWGADPLALGAMSAPGIGHAEARKVLLEPLGGRIWFAGEALHETQWGTVAGAWESGTRAAEAVLRKLGALKEPAAAKPARRRQRGKGH
ncbi:MAG TPA: NAD(P)/FAD-dependent oxidoreductase [Pseudolabrys sp.]|nr:NAD(P)/FAD-dependent oxidoreductase [Pseudolabrys sp.]